VVKLKDIIQPGDKTAAGDFFRQHSYLDRSVQYDNFDVVEAAVSSYITKTRDKELVKADKNQFFEVVTFNAIMVYRAVERFIQEKEITKVVIFNGRFDYIRAVLRVCEKLGVACEVYERVRPGGYIECFHNALPHTITERQRLIDEAWQNNPEPLEEKIRVGSNYYERKRKGEAIIARSFVLNQEKNRLPEGIDLSKKNVVLYNSSDDEIAAVGAMYKNPFFRDQEHGTQYLVDMFGTRFPEHNLIIRMHPNLRGLTYDYVKVIRGFHQKYPNVYVIPPESEVDTYALLDAAWKVISFGTSMGLEASFWNKPVILLAKARYFYADVAYVPKGVEEVESLLGQELTPKDRVNAIKFGYYYLQGGVKARYYNSTSLSSNSFKGHNLYKFTPVQRLGGYLLRMYNQIVK
jgi:hypothetical protein